MALRHHLPLFALVLFSCTGDAPTPQVELPGITRVVEEVAISGGDPVTMADLSITGMSCEMMCGGSIKKALAALPGVNSTEIVFNEGDTDDHAVVNYDPAKVSDTELVNAVQALHDGQYKVLAVKVTKQVLGTHATSAEAAATEESKPVSVVDPARMILPGIIALLSHVLRV